MIPFVGHYGRGGVVGAEERSVARDLGAWEELVTECPGRACFGGEGAVLCLGRDGGHTTVCVHLTALPTWNGAPERGDFPMRLFLNGDFRK